VENLSVVLNNVLKIIFILSNVSVMNHAFIKSLLATHLYASAQLEKNFTISIKFEYSY